MAKDGKSTATPRLRFPEFRGAEGWEKKKLSTLASLISGVHLSPDQYSKEGKNAYFTGPSDFTNEKEAISKRTDASASIAVADDTLITVKGSGVGEIWYLTLPSVVMGRQLMAVRAGNSSSRFIYQFLLTKKARFEALGSGNLIPGLSRGDILGMEDYFPSNAEQQKIADCLTSLDEVIAAQSRKLDALKAHKRGLMQQLFPREGETFPRYRFPEYRDQQEWETRALSHYISALDAGVSVNAGDGPARDAEIGILKTSCVTNGTFDSAENKVVVETEELSRVKVPVQGDTIIMSRMNTIALVGANAYVERNIPNLFLPDRLWAAKPTPHGNMRFLSYILGSDQGRAFLSSLASGSSGSMKNISKSEVLAMPISAPSLAEQQRIADCLSSLDALLAAESEMLAALKTHKKGLMQQLFPAPEGD